MEIRARLPVGHEMFFFRLTFLGGDGKNGIEGVISGRDADDALVNVGQFVGQLEIPGRVGLGDRQYRIKRVQKLERANQNGLGGNP